MQIADALDKAHRSGIIHRDLKPSKIMLTPTGAKLLNFGLAKETAALSNAATLTATRNPPMAEQGTIVGTFRYMSPEQVEGKELDGRSDIFSLGSVLYEMLTGQRAFEGKSQLSVASAILEEEPPPISSIKPMTPRRWTTPFAQRLDAFLAREVSSETAGPLFYFVCAEDFVRGDVERGGQKGGAGRRDQTYQVPAVLIRSEAEIASDQLARKELRSMLNSK